MKKFRLVVNAVLVFFIVAIAIAFTVPLQHLYVCNMSTETCDIFDPQNNYQEATPGLGIPFTNAAISTTDLRGRPCTTNCDGTIWVSIQ